MIFAKNLRKISKRMSFHRVKLMEKVLKRRNSKGRMSDAEIITLLKCFHFNTYCNFKHYYLGEVLIHWKHFFPKSVSYNVSFSLCRSALWR